MTRVDQSTYDALAAWIAQHGYAPSIRELGEVLGTKSTATYARLKRLMNAGLLAWPESSLGRRQAHTMRLVEMKPEGRVNNGDALEINGIQNS